MDNIIQVEVVRSLGDAIFQPADWSILNLPTSKAEANSMMKNLYNTPVSRHVTLLVCRHQRKNRLQALSNLAKATQTWKFLDSISITYDKPSSCSNNGFLPIAEHGFLVHKGETPDPKRTRWFNESASNATTLWDVGSKAYEGNHTRYQRFSSELNLIMYSLCGMLETRKFIYGVSIRREEVRPLYCFCREHMLTAQLYVTSQEEAQMVNEESNKAIDAYVKV